MLSDHLKRPFRSLTRTLAGSLYPESDAAFIDSAYRYLLRRKPDAGGMDGWLKDLKRGRTRTEVLAAFVGSDEFEQCVKSGSPLVAVHGSRKHFVRSLPKAARILDLGGSDQNTDFGAFYSLGYPYAWEQLTIVDLPLDERHPLYAVGGVQRDCVTPKGPVNYRYHSMADFSGIAPGSFDLIYSGQTIEHVTPDDGDKVCAGAFRALKPGGYFCVDTPNGRVTRLQQAEFIDPDHKVEYTHEALTAKLRAAGFEIVLEKGLSYIPSAAQNRFEPAEMGAFGGVYDDIRNCYLLAYVCRKPLV